MKKKITILVTGIFMTVAAISGCGSKPTNKTEAPKAEATSESTTTALPPRKKKKLPLNQSLRLLLKKAHREKSGQKLKKR